MKKTFNWLGWLLIALYLIILTALIVVGIIVHEPTKDLLYSIAMIWGCIILPILIPVTYLLTLTHLLTPKKEHAKLLVKAWQKQSVWGDGYPLEYKVPILIFEVDNGYRKAFRVSFKLFKSFQGSETGTLIYKEDGGRLFFVDFIKD